MNSSVGLTISCVTERSRRPVAINVEEYPAGERTDFYVSLFEDAMGMPLQVPFVVARGAKPGPVLGITAAVHGNELNGIRIIQQLLSELDLQSLSGSLLCVPVVNVPGYNVGQRYFSDGEDLNNKFPGNVSGVPAEQYARAFSHAFLPSCEYLVDIHTASEGRINTMYIRADLSSDIVRKMAFTVNPQIILQVRGGDGTLRNAARLRNIPAITMEAGNPSVIQGKMVFDGEKGIRNLMIMLGMLKGEVHSTREAVVCKESMWLRTTGGGILETKFKLLNTISKRQLLAETRDPFGNTLQKYYSPHDGVVIGMAANPVALPGMRFCHLGIIGETSSKRPKASQVNGTESIP